MSKRLLKTGLAVAITATSSHGFASGFALNEQSISGMGTSFAGRSSSADDASTVFGNPAGMSRLKRDEVYFGAAVIHARSDISNASANAGPLSLSGSNDGDMVPTTGVPMGYYVKPLDDKVAFGLGIYVPFGLMTDYERNFQGRYHADKSYVRVITVQPTLSYRFNDKLSVGFGPTFNHIEGELSSSLLNPLSPGSNDGQVKVKGDDTAVGFNVGVLYEFTPQTRAGLVYHSRVKYELEGDTRVSGSGALAGVAGKYDANLDLTTPESVDMSITHELNDALTLYAGSTWTRWSRFKEIRVENDAATLPANLATIVEEQNWHDTWAHAVGLAYKVSPQWTLRTGIAIDQAPINNVDRSPRVPSGDRTIFSVGAGWSPNPDMTIDVAYSYLQEESVDVNHQSPTRGDYRARYKNSAHGLGASLSYRF